MKSKLLYVYDSSLDLHAAVAKFPCHHVNGDETTSCAQWWAQNSMSPCQWWHKLLIRSMMSKFSPKCPLKAKPVATHHHRRICRWQSPQPKPCRTHRHHVIKSRWKNFLISCQPRYCIRRRRAVGLPVSLFARSSNLKSRITYPALYSILFAISGHARP